MKYYALRSDLLVYDQSVSPSLEKELENMGFKYKPGEMGGGGEAEIKEIIIAWLTMKELWIGIFSGLLANQLQKLLEKLYNWHKTKSDKVKNKKYIPEVCVFIYPHISSKRAITLFFRIDRKYSKKDIQKKLGNTKNKN